MKLRTPFNMIKNALSDIRTMHDFSYTVPNETREEFWDKECISHPTASTCKVYEGLRKENAVKVNSCLIERRFI